MCDALEPASRELHNATGSFTTPVSGNLGDLRPEVHRSSDSGHYTVGDLEFVDDNDVQIQIMKEYLEDSQDQKVGIEATIIDIEGSDDEDREGAQFFGALQLREDILAVCEKRGMVQCPWKGIDACQRNRAQPKPIHMLKVLNPVVDDLSNHLDSNVDVTIFAYMSLRRDTCIEDGPLDQFVNAINAAAHKFEVSSVLVWPSQIFRRYLDAWSTNREDVPIDSQFLVPNSASTKGIATMQEFCSLYPFQCFPLSIGDHWILAFYGSEEEVLYRLDPMDRCESAEYLARCDAVTKAVTEFLSYLLDRKAITLKRWYVANPPSSNMTGSLICLVLTQIVKEASKSDVMPTADQLVKAGTDFETSDETDSQFRLDMLYWILSYSRQWDFTVSAANNDGSHVVNEPNRILNAAAKTLLDFQQSGGCKKRRRITLETVANEAIQSESQEKKLTTPSSTGPTEDDSLVASSNGADSCLPADCRNELGYPALPLTPIQTAISRGWCSTKKQSTDGQSSPSCTSPISSNVNAILRFQLSSQEVAADDTDITQDIRTCPVCGLFVACDATGMDWTKKFEKSLLKNFKDHVTGSHYNEPLWNCLPKLDLDKTPRYDRRTKNNVATVEGIIHYGLSKAGEQLLVKPDAACDYCIDWIKAQFAVIRGIGYASATVSNADVYLRQRTKVAGAPKTGQTHPSEIQKAERKWLKEQAIDYLNKLCDRVKSVKTPGPKWAESSPQRRNNAIRIFFLEKNRHLDCPVLFHSFTSMVAKTAQDRVLASKKQGVIQGAKDTNGTNKGTPDATNASRGGEDSILAHGPSRSFGV